MPKAKAVPGAKVASLRFVLPPGAGSLKSTWACYEDTPQDAPAGFEPKRLAFVTDGDVIPNVALGDDGLPTAEHWRHAVETGVAVLG